MIKKPIFVTQPSLPPLSDFLPYLKEIWKTKILSNSGPFHNDFELKLKDYLGVQNLSLFCNGTISLITALKALKITGEVITTPYSFAATAHSLIWNEITPVFVDIERETMNISPSLIEEAITSNTTAILAVHCYGYPCKVDLISELAKKYNLKVIYDAAHAFGVSYKNRSLLSYGDISSVSFHATKVFNTFEGGALVTSSAKLKYEIDLLKNFGFENETTVNNIGINGKLSEFNSALGILQLQHIEKAISARKEVDEMYRLKLSSLDGIKIPQIEDSYISNYSYFPILIEPHFHLTRDELYEKLKCNHIFARRYFYPLISQFPNYENLPTANPENLRVATEVSNQILCLPIYPELSNGEIEHIVGIITHR